MKKFLALCIILSSPLAYGSDDYQNMDRQPRYDELAHNQDQDQMLIATQYGWGDNRDAVHIKVKAIHVVPNIPDRNPLLVLLDNHDNFYAHRLSEVMLRSLSYTDIILVDGGDVVYDLYDVDVGYKEDIESYFVYFVPAAPL